MATKKKPKTETAIMSEYNHDVIAEFFTRPEIQAAETIEQWQSLFKGASLAKTLSQQIEAVNNGNMARPEAMLLSQAHTLDVLFNNLARKAQVQTHMPHYESFLRLALKAQGQCRSTLETLAAIKNPPVIFAKQANISNGHQQINNGVPATQAEKIKNQPNELLTELPNATLDRGRTSSTIGFNTELEALE